MPLLADLSPGEWLGLAATALCALAAFAGWLTKISFDIGYVRREFEQMRKRTLRNARRCRTLTKHTKLHASRLDHHDQRLTVLETHKPGDQP